MSQRNVGEDAASAEEMEKALHIMGFETEAGFSRNCMDFNEDDELIVTSPIGLRRRHEKHTCSLINQRKGDDNRF